MMTRSPICLAAITVAFLGTWSLTANAQPMEDDSGTSANAQVESDPSVSPESTSAEPSSEAAPALEEPRTRTRRGEVFSVRGDPQSLLIAGKLGRPCTKVAELVAGYVRDLGQIEPRRIHPERAHDYLGERIIVGGEVVETVPVHVHWLLAFDNLDVLVLRSDLEDRPRIEEVHDWATYSISLGPIDEDPVELLEFGFLSRASDFEPSSVLYDNIRAVLKAP